MTTISFQNPGIIDARAYTLFGASAKVGDTPIGFFGTGLKYALAIFLRNGCKVTVWRGMERVDFSADTVNMRGTDFAVVHANGVELSYTTELGKMWKPWQAMRELWCNAIDEGGGAIEGSHEPMEGHTTITISGNAAAEAWSERASVFISSRKSWEISGIEIHDRPSKSLYYRGIRVLDLSNPSLLTYNITGHKMDLTEDRTLKYEYYARSLCGKSVVATDDECLAQRFIMADDDTFEGNIDVSDCEPSEVFDRVLREQVKFRVNQNASLRKMMQKRHGTARLLRELPLRPVEEAQLAKAYKFCQRMDLQTDAFRVVVTDGLEEGVLGMARRDERCIYLNKRTFMMGTKQVAGTLYEEFLHLQHDMNDCDRSMQNRLIDTIVTMYEDMIGEPL